MRAHVQSAEFDRPKDSDRISLKKRRHVDKRRLKREPEPEHTFEVVLRTMSPTPEFS